MIVFHGGFARCRVALLCIPLNSQPTTPMKNVLALTSLILVVSYPLAALARTLGLLPVELVSPSAFIGAFTAVNLLAIAFTSYGRQPNYDGRTARKPLVAKPEPVAEPLHAIWACNTMSA
jgi:hypothetical protein